jgi:hypothetical protein
MIFERRGLRALVTVAALPYAGVIRYYYLMAVG